jgi:hypothetical protein
VKNEKRMERPIKRSDLHLADLQYQIVHHLPSDFKVGETVFLKSNPEHSLIKKNSSTQESRWVINKYGKIYL